MLLYTKNEYRTLFVEEMQINFYERWMKNLEENHKGTKLFTHRRQSKSETR
jgi:hypothetical protein